MSQRAKINLPQAPPPKYGVSARIPSDLDIELKRCLAGTGITKQKAIEMALRDWLKLEPAQ
jgi:hypothetical protein